MSWSSGKDSALALARARQERELDVVGLLCTVNADADRVAMHAVRRDLLLAQADRLGLPVHVVELPWPCPNDDVRAAHDRAVDTAVADGVDPHRLRRPVPRRHPRATASRSSRPRRSAPCSRCGTSPPTRWRVEMIESGVRAVLTCVDPQQLAADFAGRAFDAELLADLPPTATRAARTASSTPSCGTRPASPPPSPSTLGEVVDPRRLRLRRPPPPS